MHMMKTNAAQRGGRRPDQRGVVLIMALIVLIIMTLAGIALMRSVSTTGVVAGNLGFQQAATHSADVGVETAVTFLRGATPAQLQNSILSGPGTRYVAHREDPNSTAGQSWDNFWTTTIVPSNAVNTLAADAAGNTVSYVIHRLCNADGIPITAVACSSAPPAVGSNTGSMGAGVVKLQPPPQVYYRITARVTGPRNSLSYVQVVVAL